MHGDKVHGDFSSLVQFGKTTGLYRYYQPISRSWGPEVEVDGRRLVMVGGNDYLGLTHDPRVMEAAAQAMARWGTGPGGSRLLCGNTTLLEELEARLAAFVGKKQALVHTTGFQTNLGAIAGLAPGSVATLCDREDHASVFAGCRAGGGKVVPFRHNDPASARRRLAALMAKDPRPEVMLITEGVFSMSGDVAPLGELAALKAEYPGLVFYLDDAHGVGVMGPGGRGTAAYFGVAQDMDFIMGTFSKALASIGGFIASDHEDALTYLRHHSQTMIFSAALPAANAATALACLEIIKKEPERVERLHAICRRMRAGYHDLGLVVGESASPILSFLVGDDLKVYAVVRELFARGVFASPAVFPAVPKGRGVVRTAFMSTHEERHLEKVLTALEQVAAQERIRAVDMPELAA